MSLKLGKKFDRCYKIKVPFLDGIYDLGIFFSKQSSFVLYDINSISKNLCEEKHGIKISMSKNLEASKFCETFINLHNYKKNNLDIINQFHSIKKEYANDIKLVLNETITLFKIETKNKEFFDILTIYGLSMNAYDNEFLYIISERQNIVQQLSRKIVRTTGIQISTSSAFSLLNEYYENKK